MVDADAEMPDRYADRIIADAFGAAEGVLHAQTGDAHSMPFGGKQYTAIRRERLNQFVFGFDDAVAVGMDIAVALLPRRWGCRWDGIRSRKRGCLRKSRPPAFAGPPPAL